MANFLTWVVNSGSFLVIGTEFYVTVAEAAQYMGVEYSRVMDLKYLGKLPAVQIESRWLIQSDVLRALASKRQARTG